MSHHATGLIMLRDTNDIMYTRIAQQFCSQLMVKIEVDNQDFMHKTLNQILRKQDFVIQSKTKVADDISRLLPSVLFILRTRIPVLSVRRAIRKVGTKAIFL